MDSRQMSLQPLFFSFKYTHKDAQLQLAVNLIISGQALSHEPKATYQWASSVDKFIHHAVNSVMRGTAQQLCDNNIGMEDYIILPQHDGIKICSES